MNWWINNLCCCFARKKDKFDAHKIKVFAHLSYEQKDLINRSHRGEIPLISQFHEGIRQRFPNAVIQPGTPQRILAFDDGKWVNYYDLTAISEYNEKSNKFVSYKRPKWTSKRTKPTEIVSVDLNKLCWIYVNSVSGLKMEFDQVLMDWVEVKSEPHSEQNECEDDIATSN